MEPILDLKQFLTFLSLGGAAVATQVVISIVAEKTVWFQKLTDAGRLAVTLGAAIFIGLAATLILQLTPAATLTALQPYFLTVVLAVAPFIGGEVAHRFLKKAPVITATTTAVLPASTTTTITSDGANVPPAPEQPPAEPATPFLPGDHEPFNRTNQP